MKKLLELDKKVFLKKFKRISDEFHQRLQDYVKNPSEENIHDIRVGIRRLEAAYRILPKKIRVKKYIINYVKQTKNFFKLIAKIRDFDIICAKMESRYQDRTHDLVTAIKNVRLEKLHHANELAMKILHLSVPKVSSNILNETKLNRRYLDILDRITLEIHKNMTISLEDEKRIEELHMLRKDFKKLRYSLELQSDQEKTGRVLKNLKEIQNILGEIHDNDIIIKYLQSIEHNLRISGILESEILERKRKYDAFVSTFKKRKQNTGDFYLQFKN